MSRKCFVLLNEAWSATSRDCPRLNDTQCIQNKRWAIIHTDCRWHFLILPEHICTVMGRWVRQLWLILLVCKWNLADTKSTNTCGYLRFPCMCTGRWRMDFPSMSSQKLRDDIWELHESIPALTVSVKLQWCQQIFTRCLCCPSGWSSSFPPLWETQIWRNLCCWSYTL